MAVQQVAYAVSEDETAEAHFKMLAAQHLELQRQSRKLYDHSNPFDEFQSSSGAPAGGTITVNPDYEIPERVEAILASLPVGITYAELKLGERLIPLYSGAATIVQTLINLQGLGMILNRSDPRVLNFTGVPTTGFYIGLFGHTLESDTRLR